MAINKPTDTSEFAGFIKPEAAQAYFQEARKNSVVQQLVRQVPVGHAGIEIPVVTSKPTASWVAEGGKKPTTSGGLALKTMTPKKIAAIAVVSAEVVRANPGNYMSIYRQDIAEAFASAFDAATLHGIDSPFGADQALTNTTKSVALGTATKENGGIFSDVNAGLDLLVKSKKRLTGFAFDAVTEPLFNGAVDTNGRPLFIDSPTTDTAATVRDGRLLGRHAYIGETVAKDDVVGFGGDWSKAVWGTVGGISFDISTQATVTINGELTSLWEHNLVAIRAEAEYAWLLHDKEAFIKYTTA
ncbi:phage major capsid protein [Rothia sp. P5766]|uniref:phage major capsid protein n=1 Tax=unclassified Rothia (in: high G+C Gram-positive bacteria) TaxID=2689056 RepID=UPI003AE10959